MSITQVPSETIRDLTTLRLRLRSAGMVLVATGDTGQITSRAPHGEDWLADLCCGSPLFRAALRESVERWSVQPEPEATQAMPGLWMVPLPIVARRRRAGYSIVVIPTAALLESEQFVALCQSSRVDVVLYRGMIANLPPAADVDIVRLAAVVRFMHDDHLRLTSSGEAIESVGRQLVESYEEMNLLYTIIQSMTVQERPERFVTLACQEVHATLPYAWIGTQLGADRGILKGLAGRLIVAGETRRPASEVREAAQRLLQTAQPNQAIVIEPANDARYAGYAALGGTVIAYPVTAGGAGGAVIGLLIAGDKRGPDMTASSVDTKLLGATASHLAIFLENAALYEDLNAMFLGTLEALTASIDAKDRYTCGHSRRVAHLTQQLAGAIGLDEHTVSRCHIAGLVHDVGKIGVPEAVLLKPGKLNAEEFAWIQKHPEMGHRILKDIPQLSDILPGVLYHHERWDGGGYPQGLAGEQIPLIARLIGLADSFDAMSSTRTYRSALSRPQVLDEILRCSGQQFDPDLATAFVRLDFSEFDRLVREHQASEFGGEFGVRAVPREEAA